jgi:predicted MFS family arabinose efflux permease
MYGPGGRTRGWADTYGRRLMILLAAGVFIVGALASAAALGVEVLVVARIVIGVAIGLASAAARLHLPRASISRTSRGISGPRG